MARLHDTHCHVDLYPDPGEVIAATELAGVYTVAVTNVPSVFPRCKELLSGRRFLRPALGLHPELAREYHTELGLFAALLEETRYVGEVGLDFTTRDPAERRLQREVFGRVLELAAGRGKILTVHSRRAAQDVVEMVGPAYPGRVILHWYSGPLGVLERALANGLYVSVNPAMLRSQRGQEVIRSIPLGRMLLETDGPFVRSGAGPAQPRDLAAVVEGVADLLGLEAIRVGRAAHANFRQLLHDEPPADAGCVSGPE
ncbi:putative metal-dependent hydrolase YjjV [Calidithermus terrae]|uniref:Putative metal-dependent hydrolase YjjV n=1 Tax=Calidithermus terrae TaxID=1408545 RepID=A0A399EGU7_9DEIN|nr:Qat anti-phage system TatD family nuclease QatD [Calidithermus terrae]RIH83355.1 putative metal-dependent hydrolase YjjV [Calidithermus terrae]